MSSASPSPASQDAAAEIAAVHSLGALEGDVAAALEQCRGCSLRMAAGELEENYLAVAAMAAACFQPAEPPAELRERVLAGIADVGAPPAAEPDFLVLKDQSDDWIPLPGGKIRMKVLSDLPGAAHTSILFDVDAGGSFPLHRHKGHEELYLISGDVESDGLMLAPGDYLRCAPGTKHCVSTRGGCRAIVITSRENHSRVTVGLYGWLLRKWRKRQWQVRVW